MKNIGKKIPNNCSFLKCDKDFGNSCILIQKYMDIYPEYNFVIFTGDADIHSKSNINIQKNKLISHIFLHSGVNENIQTTVLRRRDTLRSLRKSKRPDPRLQHFSSFISLTSLFVEFSIVDENFFLQVAKDIVTELREITFNSNFPISIMKRWEEIETDLELAKEKIKNIHGIDKLIKSIRRIYPSLVLSDFGVDVVLNVYNGTSTEKGEPKIASIIKKTNSANGNKSLVRQANIFQE